MIIRWAVQSDELTTQAGAVTAKKMLRVTTDGTDSIPDLAVDLWLPQLGDVYTSRENDVNGLYLDRKTPRVLPKSNWRVFDVTLDYAEAPAVQFNTPGTDFGFEQPGYSQPPPPAPGEPPPPAQENPIDQPASIDWDFQDYQYFDGKDINDKPYINTVGDPFRNPPPTILTMMVGNITFNLEKYNVVTLAGYNNTINAVPWLTFPPGKCRLNIQPGPLSTENGNLFYPILYQVSVHPLTWNPLPIMNMGDRGRKSLPSDPVQVPIDEVTKIPMNGPFRIDANGVLIDVDGSLHSDEVHFINFQQHQLRDWTPLGFKGT